MDTKAQATVIGTDNVWGGGPVLTTLEVTIRTILRGVTYIYGTLYCWATTYFYDSVSFVNNVPTCDITPAEDDELTNKDYVDTAVSGAVENLLEGNNTWEGTNTFEKKVTIQNDLEVDQDTELKGNLEVDQDTTLKGDLQVDGATTLGGSTTLEGPVTLENYFYMNEATHPFGITLCSAFSATSDSGVAIAATTTCQISSANLSLSAGSAVAGTPAFTLLAPAGSGFIEAATSLGATSAQTTVTGTTDLNLVCAAGTSDIQLFPAYITLRSTDINFLGNVDISGTIQSGDVTCGDISCGAIQSGDIDCGAIQSGDIDCGAIQAGDVACGDVTCGAVQCGDIAGGAVQCGDVTCGAIASGAIGCGAIAAAGIGCASITNAGSYSGVGGGSFGGDVNVAGTLNVLDAPGGLNKGPINCGKITLHQTTGDYHHGELRMDPTSGQTIMECACEFKVINGNKFSGHAVSVSDDGDFGNTIQCNYYYHWDLDHNHPNARLQIGRAGPNHGSAPDMGSDIRGDCTFHADAEFNVDVELKRLDPNSNPNTARLDSSYVTVKNLVAGVFLLHSFDGEARDTTMYPLHYSVTDLSNTFTQAQTSGQTGMVSQSGGSAVGTWNALNSNYDGDNYMVYPNYGLIVYNQTAWTGTVLLDFKNDTANPVFVKATSRFCQSVKIYFGGTELFKN